MPKIGGGEQEKVGQKTEANQLLACRSFREGVSISSRALGPPCFTFTIHKTKSGGFWRCGHGWMGMRIGLA